MIKENLLLVLVPMLLTGCSCSRSSTYETQAVEYTPSESQYHYKSPSEDYDHGNPYDDGSGHDAGYKWAEENSVDSCDGNSDSFIEGCEEYLRQREGSQRVEEEDSERYEY